MRSIAASFHRDTPAARRPLWWRAVAACMALWTAAALALPGDALAAPAHVHAAAHAMASQAMAHGARAHCDDAAPSPASPETHHGPAQHGHHHTCLDCCCASATAPPPAAAGAPAPSSSSPVYVATPQDAPRGLTAFLHPFPNGPPSLRA